MILFCYLGYSEGFISVTISVITDIFTTLVETLTLKSKFKKIIHCLQVYVNSPLCSTLMLESYLAVGHSNVEKEQRFDAMARGWKWGKRQSEDISKYTISVLQ